MREYDGTPMAPDHPLGGIYAVMDRHGMLPDKWCCARCAKPLNADGNHPAELYAGTWNGLCYGCTAEPAYVARVAVLDGAREVSWPPSCPGHRRDREKHTAYEGCEACGGLGVEGTPYAQARQWCRPCMKRYMAHPVRRAASRWLEQAMRSCNAVFSLAVDRAAGVPKRCTKRQRAELREAFTGPDRDHQAPEFTELRAVYLAGYTRIRALISDRLTAMGYNQWTDTRDEEAWVRAYCTWHGLDYDALKAQEEASA